jgi:hypothetical protein
MDRCPRTSVPEMGTLHQAACQASQGRQRWPQYGNASVKQHNDCIRYTLQVSVNKGYIMSAQRVDDRTLHYFVAPTLSSPNPFSG